MKKGILRNPVFFCFSVQKINSCQTGITNLGAVLGGDFKILGSVALGEAADAIVGFSFWALYHTCT
jgi:hypothetical protein